MDPQSECSSPLQRMGLVTRPLSRLLKYLKVGSSRCQDRARVGGQCGYGRALEKKATYQRICDLKGRDPPCRSARIKVCQDAKAAPPPNVDM